MDGCINTSRAQALLMQQAQAHGPVTGFTTDNNEIAPSTAVGAAAAAMGIEDGRVVSVFSVMRLGEVRKVPIRWYPPRRAPAMLPRSQTHC